MKMTVRDALQRPPHIIREVFGKLTEINRLTREHYNFLAGAAFWRIHTSKSEFTLEDRRAIGNHHISERVFKEYREMGFTPEEMDLIDERDLPYNLLHKIAVAVKTKDPLFYHLTTLSRKELNRICAEYGNQIKRFRWGPHWVSGPEIAFLDGMIIFIQKSFGITSREAMLIPFLVYKAVIEFKPTKRLRGLENLLEDFGLPPRLARDIFPTLAWRAEEEEVLDKSLVEHP